MFRPLVGTNKNKVKISEVSGLEEYVNTLISDIETVDILPTSDFEAVTLASPGGNTWFTDPRSIIIGGDSLTPNRILIVGALAGPSGGDVVVHGIDLSTKEIVRFTLSDNLEVDDHDNPSFIRLSDGRIRAFYCKHPDTQMRTRVTTNPVDSVSDLATWDAETTGPNVEDASYSNPLYLAAEDKIFLFWRDGLTPEFNPRMSWSDDDGATWSTPVEFYQAPDTHRGYAKFWATEDKIHIWITLGHPRTMADNTNHIVHFYYQNDKFYKSDGSLICDIETLPVVHSQATRVHDAGTEGGNGWTWSIATDSQGKPVVTYAVFVTADDHRFRYARYDGVKWNKEEIVAGGYSLYGPAPTAEEEYSGGVVVDHRNTSVVWACPLINGKHELVKYIRIKPDMWKGEQITSNSRNKNYRPYVPFGARRGEPVLWNYGSYTSYVSYAAVTKALIDNETFLDLFSDEFVGTDGADLAYHKSDSGHTWVWHGGLTTGAIFIKSNGVYCSVAGSRYIINGPQLPADPIIEGTITVVTDNNSSTLGPIFFADATTQDYLHYRYDTTTDIHQLYKFINGTGTLIDSYSGSIGSEFVIDVKSNGDINIKIDGVSRITAVAADYPEIPRKGMLGIRGSGTATSTTGLRLDRLATVQRKLSITEIEELSQSGKGFVNHGTNADVARPTGYSSVEWTGSVSPNNSISGDTWVQT